jgi:quercetin dioxygenase-like cupin family protein
VTSQHDQIDLARGDSASYRADVPHAIENLGKGPAMLILVVIYQ